MIRSVAEAQALILADLDALPAEMTPVSSHVLGQILAGDILSDIDAPPYAKALMDGYAVHSEDCASAPVTLPVQAEVAAGASPVPPLQRGQCIRIFTGAPLPEGADSVVPQEATQAGEGGVQLLTPVKAGAFVLAKGREMRAGQVVLRAGDRLQPESFGILASVGKTSFQGHPEPRLAIISTGNELVEPMMRLKPGMIRNSNGSMLTAQATRAGGLPRYLGIATDQREHLTSLVKQGLEIAEVTVLAGGVSVGKYDLVPQVLESLGVEAVIHRVQMKPGKPFYFGKAGKRLVFGLPGNPVSSFVCFELFVRPAIRRLRGEAEPMPCRMRLPLTHALRAENDRPTYHPARLHWTESGLQVEPLPWFGSPDLAGIRGTTALLELPAGAVDYPAAHPVATLLLEGP